MKKTAATLICVAAMVLLPACGSNNGAAGEPANPAAAAAKNENAPLTGEAYDCTYFTITVVEGWVAGPLTFGMVNVLPKGKVSPGLYFKFEGDGNAAGTAEGSIGSMIQNYGGSPMSETTVAGTAFKSTTYSYSGMTQTMHVAYGNGTKITITIEGENGKDNPDIKAMLASLKLK
ncbi:MAG: hypothetical protein NTW95_09855 [Candidatus Aminicenantes bacterium]|nr:hypothetical protein [Candidatus Aminicenantes bacterium]